MALISIVLVSYNERENIAKLIPMLEDIFHAHNLTGEVVVVDDSSPDGTGELVNELALSYGNILLISRPRKLGPGSAFADGYRAASGEIIIGMDTDFSHDPHDIPRFIRQIDEGFDIVLASRYIHNGHYQVTSVQTLKKSIISRAGNILIRVISRVPLHDFTTSFRAIRREVVSNVKVDSTGNSFFMEFVVRAYRKGYRMTELPITFRDRFSG
jgi:dolichol-phosphate mannosyltransferase